ncbi:hypothetical protein P7K49_029800 [Saguinus oedipus]|uniref:Uncharacterized protein n=1 Tax=Saguinus oedipus TaxID=9490 RepID=A0ABQ9U8B5_SAGOE|nr:hypothetical protein P7K49_029800 [Saguinus oedipus]
MRGLRRQSEAVCVELSFSSNINEAMASKGVGHDRRNISNTSTRPIWGPSWLCGVVSGYCDIYERRVHWAELIDGEVVEAPGPTAVEPALWDLKASEGHYLQHINDQKMPKDIASDHPRASTLPEKVSNEW